MIVPESIIIDWNTETRRTDRDILTKLLFNLLIFILGFFIGFITLFLIDYYTLK
jgi:hypothetical protein